MKLPWILACMSCMAAGSPEVFYNVPSSNTYSNTGGSLFGFSVSSVFSGPRSHLVVGAPLADAVGAVFTCNLNGTSSSCNAVEKTIIDRFVEKPEYANDSYWFGATVKGNDNFFVGCAPHLIDKTIGNDFNGVGTFGQCYTSVNVSEVQNKLVYLTQTRNKPSLRDHDLMEQTIDSFGWSLDIVDSSSSIVAGSPVLTSGMIYIRDLSNLKGNEPANYTYHQGSKSSERFNFGYSVASFRAKSDKTYFAVGSTYNHGSVTYLTDNTPRRPNKKNTKKLMDGTTGSMFGATLCTARLSRPALLVGSPACPYKDSYNVGSVHVYISTDPVETPHTLVKTIFGEMSQSFFGSAIASLGDLNGDHQDEIAIGAPYEDDGQGAVYIYSGAELTKPGDTMYARYYQQKIRPSATYKTFGYSLASIRDYDDNGCNELAIGIPESSAVMVLRCAAAITIHLKPFPYSLSKADSVKLAVCFIAEFPDKPSTVEADISVKIKIQHPDATLQGGKRNGSVSTLSKIININEKKEQYCEDIYMTLDKDGSYHNKIFYEMSATLVKDPMSDRDYKASHVKLNETSETKLTGSIWIQECGETVCTPKLSITTEFSEKVQYEIGSSDTIDVATSVINAGDVAYDTCVSVLVTGAQALVTEDCKVIESTDGLPLGVQCRPKQLLRNTKPWNATVVVDTTALSNLDETISINVTLYELCGNGSTVKDTRITTFQLYPDAESVEILGRTDESASNMVNMTKSDIASRKSFEHIYTIRNTGNTNWKDVNINIQLEKQDFVTSFVHHENDSATCQLTNVNATTAEYGCVAPTLGKHAEIEVKVVMQVVPNKLSDRIRNENLTVHSEIYVYLNKTTREKSVISVLRLVEGTVPIWIIIAASILALIILVIIFFILRECGFLKRKNREELNRARMSIRRQTVLRRTMGSRPPSDDQEPMMDTDVASAIERQGKKKKDHRVVIKDTDSSFHKL